MAGTRFSTMEDSALMQLVELESQRPSLDDSTRNELYQELVSRGMLEDGGAQQPAAPQANVGGLVKPVVAGITGGEAAGSGAAAESGIGLGGVASYLPAIGGIIHGGLTAKKFAEGKKLSTPEKLAYALPTGGLSLLSDTLQGFGDKNKFQDEQKRLLELQREGVIGADYPILQLKKGRSKEELTRQDLPPDFVGFAPDGTWVNNKFAQSRNEKDLQGTDIQGFSVFLENLGKEYADAPLQKKIDIAQEALNRGIASEGGGTIDIKDDGSFWDWAKTQLTAPAEETKDSDSNVEIPAVAGAPVEKPTVDIPEKSDGLTLEGDAEMEALLSKIGELAKSSKARKPSSRSLIVNSLLDSTEPDNGDMFSGSEFSSSALISNPLFG